MSAEGTVAKFGATRGQSILEVVNLKLHRFDGNEPENDEPFRSLVEHFIWFAKTTRSAILNAVRAVESYSAALKSMHRQAALHILMYLRY